MFRYHDAISISFLFASIMSEMAIKEFIVTENFLDFAY